MPRTRLLESVAAARCGDHYSQPRWQVSRAAARQISAPGFTLAAERCSWTVPGDGDARRPISLTAAPATAHSPGSASRTAGGEPPAPIASATNSGPAQRLPRHTVRTLPAGHYADTVVGTKPRTATSSARSRCPVRPWLVTITARQPGTSPRDDVATATPPHRPRPPLQIQPRNTDGNARPARISGSSLHRCTAA
ncbi:hypothetical protein SAMN06272775_3730 [Streptomyces sp. 2323.1]|nr:hypothetical protein SAMN06272775_3730 [Streptomyces sp. 2323.1]